jgi:hypothetical protein
VLELAPVVKVTYYRESPIARVRRVGSGEEGYYTFSSTVMFCTMATALLCESAHVPELVMAAVFGVSYLLRLRAIGGTLNLREG